MNGSINICKSTAAAVSIIFDIPITVRIIIQINIRIYLCPNPPNSKVWGSLLEKGNAPQMGAGAIWWQVDGSWGPAGWVHADRSWGEKVPDGWHWVGVRGAAWVEFGRAALPDTNKEHRAPTQRAPAQSRQSAGLP